MAITLERGLYRVRWVDKRTKQRMSQSFPRGTPRKDVEEFELKVKLGLIMQTEEKSVPTLGVYVDRFLTVYPSLQRGKLREKSTMVKDLSTVRNHLKPIFGSWRLDAIKPKHVLDYQSALLAEGYAPQSIRNILSLLSSVFKLAQIEELVEFNPVASVPKVSRTPEESEPPAFWSFKEKDEFLVTVRETDFALFQLAAFALETGGRIGELEGLLGDALDLDGGFVDFKRTFCSKERRIKNRTKGGVPRRVFLSPAVIAVMANKGRVAATEPVFSGMNFSRLGIDRLAPACLEARVKRITPHGWRHTFASHLIMQGRPAKDVQVALGHKKISTTLDTYAHLLEEHKRGLTDSLSAGMRWTLAADTRVVPLAFGGRSPAL